MNAHDIDAMLMNARRLRHESFYVSMAIKKEQPNNQDALEREYNIRCALTEVIEALEVYKEISQ